ncbi:MAG TPA: hypothetical protein VHX61_05495 [Rhizomicrobium sp.]|jgi:hypothetical protein|nr:hypothetical protein [Rhizomicrobium sp.]
MKRLIGMMMALALTGCDTIGGIKYTFDSGSFTDRTTAVADACAARMKDRGLDAIRDKVELFKSPPDGPVPFAILTDNATAAPAEQPAIGVWASTMEACQAKARQLMDDIPVPPQPTQSEVDKLTSYITDAWIDGSKLRVALYSGQITYADYASKRLTLAQDALKTAERYAQDMDEENQTQDLEKVEAALAPFVSMM